MKRKYTILLLPIVLLPFSLSGCNKNPQIPFYKENCIAMNAVAVDNAWGDRRAFFDSTVPTSLTQDGIINLTTTSDGLTPDSDGKYHWNDWIQTYVCFDFNMSFKLSDFDDKFIDWVKSDNMFDSFSPARFYLRFFLADALTDINLQTCYSDIGGMGIPFTKTVHVEDDENLTVALSINVPFGSMLRNNYIGDVSDDVMDMFCNNPSGAEQQPVIFAFDMYTLMYGHIVDPYGRTYGFINGEGIDEQVFLFSIQAIDNIIPN